jgi:hypothetical protein
MPTPNLNLPKLNLSNNQQWILVGSLGIAFISISLLTMATLVPCDCNKPKKYKNLEELFSVLGETLA